MENPKRRVLMVDDEPALLAGLMRTLRSEHYDLTPASSGPEALALMDQQGPFAVVVSDLHMPGMDGVEFLGLARKHYPETIRVLFTGQPDLEHAVAAVNEGAIFRFITKPCSRVILALTLKNCVEQYELITSRRVLLEQTLHGSIKALIEVLELTSPMAFGRSTRLRTTVRELVAHMHAADGWQIELAAMFSQIGYATLPQPLLEKLHHGHIPTAEEEHMIKHASEAVDQVLANIPRMEGVRSILRLQNQRADLEVPANEPEDASIQWGARALRAILELDKLENDGMSSSVAIATLRGRTGGYDPAILDALASLRNAKSDCTVRELPLIALRPGMILAQDVWTKNGLLFVAHGQEVTLSLVHKLDNFSSGFEGSDLIRVVIPNPAAEDVH